MAEPSAGDDRWEALARYLAGESSPEEVARIQRLLAEEPERAAAMNALASMMRSLEPPPPPNLDVDAAWLRTRARMREMDVVPLPLAQQALRPAGPGQPRRWRGPMLLTGALAAALAGLLLWSRLAPSGPRETSRVIATPIGGRDSITFPDGSRILVAPGSRLVLSHLPGERPSTATLEGEAFFDIPHDAARPFRVEAGSVEISDLGTRFSVRHRESAATEVEVMQGSVGFGLRGANPVVLQAGDRGVQVGTESPRVTRAALGSEPPAWTEGRLVFADVGFSRVQDDLRRWFGIELETRDTLLAARHFTASFQGESVRQVVDILALTVGATAEWRGDTASLRAPTDRRGRQ